MIYLALWLYGCGMIPVGIFLIHESDDYPMVWTLRMRAGLLLWPAFVTAAVCAWVIWRLAYNRGARL